MKAPTPTKELVAEGNYVATIYRIIYIGTEEGEYKGVPNSAFKVDITWELNDEMKVWKEGEEAKPIAVSQQYTLSMGSKSNLRPIVEGIVGGMSDAEAYNYDIDELLGKACLVSITHGVSETGKEKLKLQTSKLMKSMTVPKPFNEQWLLSFTNWNESKYQNLPEWMKKKISETPEYQTMKGTYKTKFELPVVKIDAIDTGEEIDLSSIPF
jgi:hypothetical protein